MKNRFEELCDDVAGKIVSLIGAEIEKRVRALVAVQSPSVGAKRRKTKRVVKPNPKMRNGHVNGSAEVSVKDLIVQALKGSKMAMGATELMFKGASEAYVRKLLSQLKAAKVIKPAKERGKYLAA